MAREYVEPNVEKEAIEVEYDLEVWLSQDEEEDNDNDTKSLKSKGTYHKMLSEYKQSQKLGESPELFRLKAKMRMNSSSKKFALVIDEAMNLVNADQMNMSSSLKKSMRMRQKKALIALDD